MESDGRPIGFIQIIDPAREETHYWSNVDPELRAIDIWIGEAADLGRGYGARMMRLALERCFAESRAPRIRGHRSVLKSLSDPSDKLWVVTLSLLQVLRARALSDRWHKPASAAA